MDLPGERESSSQSPMAGAGRRAFVGVAQLPGVGKGRTYSLIESLSSGGLVVFLVIHPDSHILDTPEFVANDGSVLLHAIRVDVVASLNKVIPN